MCLYWSTDLVRIENAAMQRLIGRAEASGHVMSAHAHAYPASLDALQALANGTGEPILVENVAFAIDRVGDRREAFYTFAYTAIGRAPEETGVLCTAYETTERVRRESASRGIADGSTSFVYAHRSDFSLEWANDRWSTYTGLSYEEAISPRGLARLLHPDDLAEFRAELTDAFTTGRTYEANIRIRPDGSGDVGYRWFFMRGVPMRDANDCITRWAGSATDIHDRHTIEKAINVRFASKVQALVDFQHAAMPQHLPIIDGLRFSAVYESAQADALVGGDWYDAFPLSDGRIVLSVGDVSGSGLQAAVTMGAVRQTIRGAVQLYPDPVAVLDAADRALRLEQPDRIVTAFVGIFDPVTRGFSFASAGHPPPLLRAADGTISELVATDLPLGIRDQGISAEAGWAVFPEDGLLVLHTDGLTESTRNILEGNARLFAALASDAVYAASDPAKAVRDAVIDGASSDDVAILVMRLDAASARKENRVWSFDGADATQAALVRRDVAAAMVRIGADDDEVADAELVVGELIGNIVRHANGTIVISLDMTADGPVLHVFDRGPGFTFGTRLPRDAMSESGRGLFIVSRIAREFSVMPRWDGGSHARVVLKTQSIE